MTNTLFGDEHPTLVVFVAGQPAPQGSKTARAVYTGSGPDREFTGKTILHEKLATVGPWRKTIVAACQDPNGQPLVHFPKGTPVTCTLEFVMRRPKSEPKRRATRPHTTYPDIDKLERAVFDALTAAGIWADDGQVNSGYRSKRYAEQGEVHGVHIRLTVQGAL